MDQRTFPTRAANRDSFRASMVSNKPLQDRLPIVTRVAIPCLQMWERSATSHQRSSNQYHSGRMELWPCLLARDLKIRNPLPQPRGSDLSLPQRNARQQTQEGKVIQRSSLWVMGSPRRRFVKRVDDFGIRAKHFIQEKPQSPAKKPAQVFWYDLRII